uniref:Uncharacterized protein n=1 Tax=Cacopsylla melanoneura TaxID=428564 RepID=A0A8D8WHA0_9HEMI
MYYNLFHNVRIVTFYVYGVFLQNRHYVGCCISNSPFLYLTHEFSFRDLSIKGVFFCPNQKSPSKLFRKKKCFENFNQGNLRNQLGGSIRLIQVVEDLLIG